MACESDALRPPGVLVFGSSDRVNHEVLMGRLAKRIGDCRMPVLIRRYLGAGVLANGLAMELTVGRRLAIRTK